MKQLFLQNQDILLTLTRVLLENVQGIPIGPQTLALSFRMERFESRELFERQSLMEPLSFVESFFPANKTVERLPLALKREAGPRSPCH